ncbi:MAG: DedA family protein, partial [Bacillota bacterium]
MLNLLTERIITIVMAGGPLAVFLVLVLESACVPIPSEIVLPLAGILVTQGSVGFWTVVAVATAGQLVGSLLSYALGLYGGRPLLNRWAYGRHGLAVAEGWFKRRGEAAVLVGRLLPGVRTFISVPAGLARMPLARFVTYSLIGTVLWTTVLIWAGTRAAHLWEQPAWRSAFRDADLA